MILEESAKKYQRTAEKSIQEIIKGAGIPWSLMAGHILQTHNEMRRTGTFYHN